MMARAAMLTLMLLTTLPAAAAEEVEAKLEALDADFLDYLASMEAEDDDWTVLAADAETPRSDKEAPKPAQPAPKKTDAAGDRP